jgi:vitamin B12 transporter
MFFLCPGRLGTALRHFRISSLVFLISIAASAPALAAGLAGQVVDATGRVLPRAYVRVLSENGATVAGGFTDGSGRFSLTADLPAPCRVETSLTGFQTTIVPCAQDEQRITLLLAPVRETVIVSATRTDAPASQVGASATVYTAADLERLQKPLLADLLVATPGAMLIRNGGPGTVTSLFVRGGESDYNKILLDGVPLNEPGGTFFLSNLTTENLDRIEVVRGAYSSLFGSDAMASVIQLFTKRPQGGSTRPQVSAQVDGGTYGTLHATAAVSGARQRIDYSLGAARLDSDNRVPNSALENTTLNANIGVALAPDTSLRFIARAEREHVGTPGTTAYGRPDLDAFFERHDGVGSLQFDQQVHGRLHQRASYSLAASYQQSTDLLADPPYTAMFKGKVGVFPSSDFLNDSSNDFRRHNAAYQADLHLPSAATIADNTLTFLADWNGERVTATNRRTGLETINSRDNFGAALQDQLLWRRVFVTVGGRIEKNEDFGTAFVPRGTIVYVVREASSAAGETRVKASAGSGIKEPTLAESFSVSPFALGNPDLDPERSRSAEVGIEQRLANQRAKVALTYFDNHFSDVIQLITTNPSTFEGKYFNTGVTRARGIELGAEAAPVAAVRLRANYTLLDGKVTESAVPDDTVFGLGNTLFRRPRNSGSVGVWVQWQRLTADLNGAFIGRFADSDFGLFSPSFKESPGHSLWDARVTATLTRGLTGVLMIDNLTNQDYSEPFGYQPLLRTVRVGVRVNF